LSKQEKESFFFSKHEGSSRLLFQSHVLMQQLLPTTIQEILFKIVKYASIIFVYKNG